MLPMSSSSLLVGIQNNRKAGHPESLDGGLVSLLRVILNKPLPLILPWKVRDALNYLSELLLPLKSMNLDILEGRVHASTLTEITNRHRDTHINQAQNMGREETESENNACWAHQTFLRKIKQAFSPLNSLCPLVFVFMEEDVINYLTHVSLLLFSFLLVKTMPFL